MTEEQEDDEIYVLVRCRSQEAKDKLRRIITDGDVDLMHKSQSPEKISDKQDKKEKKKERSSTLWSTLGMEKYDEKPANDPPFSRGKQ